MEAPSKICAFKLLIPVCVFFYTDAKTASPSLSLLHHLPSPLLSPRRSAQTPKNEQFHLLACLLTTSALCIEIKHDARAGVSFLTFNLAALFSNDFSSRLLARKVRKSTPRCTNTPPSVSHMPRTGSLVKPHLFTSSPGVSFHAALLCLPDCVFVEISLTLNVRLPASIPPPPPSVLFKARTLLNKYLLSHIFFFPRAEKK